MRNKIIALLSLVVILVLFNITIYHNEKIIKNGRTVLLKLAPVDPRSLMQGDYMDLEYNIAAQLRQMMPDYKDEYEYINTENDNGSNKKAPKTIYKGGKIVISTDEHNVAKFVKFYDNKPLDKNEFIISYDRTGWDHHPQFKPNTFMFQEGKNDLFAKAKYGIWKFDKNNNKILVGLADENYKEIK